MEKSVINKLLVIENLYILKLGIEDCKNVTFGSIGLVEIDHDKNEGIFLTSENIQGCYDVQMVCCLDVTGIRLCANKEVLSDIIKSLASYNIKSLLTSVSETRIILAFKQEYVALINEIVSGINTICGSEMGMLST